MRNDTIFITILTLSLSLSFSSTRPPPSPPAASGMHDFICFINLVPGNAGFLSKPTQMCWANISVRLQPRFTMAFYARAFPFYEIIVNDTALSFNWIRHPGCCLRHALIFLNNRFLSNLPGMHPAEAPFYIEDSQPLTDRFCPWMSFSGDPQGI